jgi:manganese/zinc/iron transport system substrate-binding protein
MLKFSGWLIGLIVLTLCFNGCSSSSEARTGKPLVVCTTGMVADLARHVGEPHLEVVALLGPGTDPHLYKPTEGDLQTLSRADLILYNGLHLEGKMTEIFEKMRHIKATVAVAEAIPTEKLRTPPEFKGNPDPHVWHDVSFWMMALEHTTQALIELDPANRAEYERKAGEYKKELETLHEWCKSRIQTIPAQQRVLVTAHDAFGYFGLAYGIEVKALQGISTVSEYGIQDVSNLATFIVSRKIKAVFVESSIPKRSIEAVIEGCRSRGHAVSIGGTLYSDALGPPGSGADTYTGMIRANVDHIVRALK